MNLKKKSIPIKNTLTLLLFTIALGCQKKQNIDHDQIILEFAKKLEEEEMSYKHQFEKK